MRPAQLVFPFQLGRLLASRCDILNNVFIKRVSAVDELGLLAQRGQKHRPKVFGVANDCAERCSARKSRKGMRRHSCVVARHIKMMKNIEPTTNKGVSEFVDSLHRVVVHPVCNAQNMKRCSILQQ